MQHLPQEVRQLIFNHIEQNDDAAKDPSPFKVDSPPFLVRSNSHQRHLVELTLVCHAWLPFARRALFKRLELFSTSSAELLLKLISQQQVLPSWIETFYVGSKRDNKLWDAEYLRTLTVIAARNPVLRARRQRSSC